MSELLAPDCELLIRVPDWIPLRRRLWWTENVIGWFTHELWRWFDEFTSTPEAVHRRRRYLIVVPVKVKARAKNGKALDVHNLWVSEFKDGKLTKARVYADTAVLRDVVSGGDVVSSSDRRPGEGERGSVRHVRG